MTEPCPVIHLNEAAVWRPIVEGWRDKGLRIASTNGTFDLVHGGHLRLLREARAQGDRLVLGLNSDASVKAYKSPKRPIVPQEERAGLLSSLRFVDLVLLFDEPESLRFVSELKPDVHVKDATYGYDLIEAPVVGEYGGRIHLVENDGRSTTNIIQRVIELYRDDPSCL